MLSSLTSTRKCGVLMKIAYLSYSVVPYLLWLYKVRVSSCILYFFRLTMIFQHKGISVLAWKWYEWQRCIKMKDTWKVLLFCTPNTSRKLFINAHDISSLSILFDA